MITSRTIQHNSDRAYDISFILLSHNEENDQKMEFRDLKCRNEAQNQNLREKLSKTGLVENFLLWLKSTINGQSQRSTDDVCWRGSVTSPRAYVAGYEAQQARGACGRAWDWHMRRVADTSGAWSACSWGRNFSRRVATLVMQFLAILGWVLLGINGSVFLCLFFGCWMSKTLISESCRYCGRDGGGSLLTVTTGWRWGQWKNAGDVHRNQKVRGMALIPC